MKLFHFTCLYHLPSICREGIAKGEVPLTAFRALNAPNLTSNPNPAAQHWTLGGVLDKTKVRIAVNIPDGDERLESWHKACERLRIERGVRRLLDRAGQGQGKFWFLFWGTIPPAWFDSVSLRNGSTCVPLSGADLDTLCERIDKERVKIVTEEVDGMRVVVAGFDSWLIDNQQSICQQRQCGKKPNLIICFSEISGGRVVKGRFQGLRRHPLPCRTLLHFSRQSRRIAPWRG